MAKQKPRQSGNPARNSAGGKEADVRKVNEVEEGMSNLPAVPDDVAAEAPPLEQEAAMVNPTRLKNLYDKVRQQGENYKRAQEKLSALEADLAGKRSEVSEQEAALALREADLAAAEKDVE